MKAQPAREALDHFTATAIIGLALTALGDVLPVLTARQEALGAATAGYVALSLLTAAGMGLYGYIKSHQAQLEASLAQVLDAVPAPPASPAATFAPQAAPAQAAGPAPAAGPGPAAGPAAGPAPEQEHQA